MRPTIQMIKKKQIFFNPLKGHDPNNLKLEAEEKANSLNKNQNPSSTGTRRPIQL